jgi:hypothetical protein
MDSLQLEMQSFGDMAAVYCMGLQQSKKVHFHLILLFYNAPRLSPEDLNKVLEAAIWTRWKKLATGVRKCANGFNLRSKARGLDYLLQKHVVIATSKVARGNANWFGVRNRMLLAENAVPVSKKEVREALTRAYPLASLRSQPMPVKQASFTAKDVTQLKGYIEYRGRDDWEEFKRRRTRKTGKVSDAAFLNFLNGGVYSSPPDDNTL